MIPKSPPKGRGAISNRSGRFESWDHQEFDDGWYHEELPALKTTIENDNARTVIARNRSPDLPFDRSINMYRGCEHGCSYCYARPSHTYLGYSAGLDFETKLFAKHDVAEKLTKEITADSYQCQTIALGANTDPYQPVERNLRLTRQILEVLLEHRHPLQITTKSASIMRDIDLLSELARHNLVGVNVSITSLDAGLTRRLEPRASAPHSRIKAVSRLVQHQIPITIFVAPVIPGLNDHEVETILESCAQAGARRAEWTMIRLPLEVADLFREWLRTHYPGREARVMSLIQQVRGGRTNSSEFFERMRGTGPIAEMIHKRFVSAVRKFGLDTPPVELDVAKFRKTVTGAVQMSLFT
ncbi:MAG: PA0069 family radical SAM protein [Acidiferrobacterales bacterium]|nr:PA0069 family radical SAM protein [Acidiferrobacterales bacterium]